MCQDSGSSNIDQAQREVIGGLRYSTLATRVAVLRRRQNQYSPQPSKVDRPVHTTLTAKPAEGTGARLPWLPSMAEKAKIETKHCSHRLGKRPIDCEVLVRFCTASRPPSPTGQSRHVSAGREQAFSVALYRRRAIEEGRSLRCARALPARPGRNRWIGVRR